MLLDKVREMAKAKQKEVCDHPEKYNEDDLKYINAFVKLLSPWGIDLFSEIPKPNFQLGLVFIGFDAHEAEDIYAVLKDSLDIVFLMDPDETIRLKTNNVMYCKRLLARGLSPAEVAEELEVSEKYVQLCIQYEMDE